MFISLKRMSDQCDGRWEWFDVNLHTLLKKMLKFQVDTTSIKWLLVVTTVTVQSYARKRFPYCWIGCLLKLRYAESGLMSFSYNFARKTGLMRLILDVIPYPTCLRSRNMYFKGSEIDDIGIISEIQEWWVDWHRFILLKLLNLLVLVFGSITTPHHTSSNNVNSHLWTVHQDSRVSYILQVESKEIKLFFHQNSPQSTRSIESVHLTSWRPSGFLFNYIFTDRIGVNHGGIVYSSETKIFGDFLSNFHKEF